MGGYQRHKIKIKIKKSLGVDKKFFLLLATDKMERERKREKQKKKGLNKLN